MAALRQARSRRLLVLILGVFAIIALGLLNSPKHRGAVNWTTARGAGERRGEELGLLLDGSPSRKVTKVSMLYGNRNTLYERALLSHRNHAKRWGYGMKVLQNDIAVGYWNKPSYLLSLVVSELARPALDRAEWLMWIDADCILINPAIPLEIFLPPHDIDDIHMVASKDQNGLNTGIFFLRVHQWTIRMLIDALAYPAYQPDIDLGASPDQKAMELVLNRTTGGPEGKGYKNGLVYLPRTWINTYEWKHAYEGVKGNLLVHFPGLGEDRWPHMSKWLDVVETTPGEWEVPLAETWYVEESAGFWERVRRAKKILRDYDEMSASGRSSSGAAGASLKGGTARLELAAGEIRKLLQEERYEADLFQQRIDDWDTVRKSS